MVNPDCTGIDISKERRFLAVDPEWTEEPVRSFVAFTRDLGAMTAWLGSRGVTKVTNVPQPVSGTASEGDPGVFESESLCVLYIGSGRRR